MGAKRGRVLSVFPPRTVNYEFHGEVEVSEAEWLRVMEELDASRKAGVESGDAGLPGDSEAESVAKKVPRKRRAKR